MILGGIACFIVSLIPGGTGRTGKHEKVLRWGGPQYGPGHPDIGEFSQAEFKVVFAQGLWRRALTHRSVF